MGLNKAAYLVTSTLVLTAALQGAPALATPITFVSSGVIRSGVDTLGWFTGGAGDVDMSGKAFQQSLTLDTDLFKSVLSGATTLAGAGLTGLVTQTVKIGDYAQTYKVTPLDVDEINTLALANNRTQNPGAGFAEDSVIAAVYGTTAGFDAEHPNYFQSFQYGVSDGALAGMALALAFDQQWSYNVQATDNAGGLLSFQTPGGGYAFYLDLSYLSLNVDAALPEAAGTGTPGNGGNGGNPGSGGVDLPEPSAPVWLGLGLMALVSAKRRKAG